jgi:uncharacterized protein YdaU (DUF1376 family)
MLEWSIPESWRTKFDLAGYVLTEFTKEWFMTECEAVKQNEPKHSNKNNNSIISGKTVTHKKSHGGKHRSTTQKKDTTTAKFYCTKHGQNPRTLKKKRKASFWRSPATAKTKTCL